MKNFLILPVLMAAFQLNAVDPKAHDAFMENPFTPESHKFVTKMYYAAASAERFEERTNPREDIRMNSAYQVAQLKLDKASYEMESGFLKQDYPDRDPQVLEQNYRSARAEAEELRDDLENVRLPNLDNMRLSKLMQAKQALQTISNAYDKFVWNEVPFEDDKARLAMHHQQAKQYQAIFNIPGFSSDPKTALGLMYDKYEAHAEDAYKIGYQCMEKQFNK